MRYDTDIKALAEAWVALSRLTERVKSAEYNALWWAYMDLQALIDNDPERAWCVIQTIWEIDANDDVLCHLGAGPLEDLLVTHGNQFIDRFEVLSKKNATFRRLLGAVWQNAMGDELWERVQAIAGPSSYREEAAALWDRKPLYFTVQG